MFTDGQKMLLGAKLDGRAVKERTQSGRKLSYLESWYVEDRANDIFGFDGWSSTILKVECVGEHARKLSSGGDGWSVSYIAMVRVCVGDVIRDGAGAGHGIDRDIGLAHESALKEATSDAEKRALKTFGNQFGLALYDKTRENVETAAPSRHEGRWDPMADGLASQGVNAPEAIRRLSAAQAKERGIHTAIEDAIAGCLTLVDLALWDAQFDKHTAQCPQSWLDAIHNKVVLRKEEILAEQNHAAMDEEYKAVMA